MAGGGGGGGACAGGVGAAHGAAHGAAALLLVSSLLCEGRRCIVSLFDHSCSRESLVVVALLLLLSLGAVSSCRGLLLGEGDGADDTRRIDSVNCRLFSLDESCLKVLLDMPATAAAFATLPPGGS